MTARRAWIAAAVALIALGIFLLVDSAGDEDDPGGTLAGSKWVVAEMPGVALVPDSLPILHFTGRQVGGDGGCNSLSGTYVTLGRTIDISDLSTTLIGCPDAIARQEAAFTARLEAATTYEISGASLRIDGDQGAIVFGRA
jgi:heat shock protein HslJ